MLRSGHQRAIGTCKCGLLAFFGRSLTRLSSKDQLASQQCRPKGITATATLDNLFLFNSDKVDLGQFGIFSQLHGMGFASETDGSRARSLCKQAEGASILFAFVLPGHGGGFHCNTKSLLCHSVFALIVCEGTFLSPLMSSFFHNCKTMISLLAVRQKFALTLSTIRRICLNIT